MNTEYEYLKILQEKSRPDEKTMLFGHGRTEEEESFFRSIVNLEKGPEPADTAELVMLKELNEK